jgi:predicted nucleic acid-binding protein
MKIVIDTNIFISALIRKGKTREIFVNSKNLFLFPEFELKERTINRR